MTPDNLGTILAIYTNFVMNMVYHQKLLDEDETISTEDFQYFTGAMVAIEKLAETLKIGKDKLDSIKGQAQEYSDVKPVFRFLLTKNGKKINIQFQRSIDSGKTFFIGYGKTVSNVEEARNWITQTALLYRLDGITNYRISDPDGTFKEET